MNSEQFQELILLSPSIYRTNLVLHTNRIVSTILVWICILLSLDFLINWFSGTSLTAWLVLPEKLNYDGILKNTSALLFFVSLFLATLFFVIKKISSMVITRNRYIFSIEEAWAKYLAENSDNLTETDKEV